MIRNEGRILAVDPGEKRIGLAVSDENQFIARPLKIIRHVSRLIDAATIAETARELDAVMILVGNPLNSEGQPGPMARKAMRLAGEIAIQANIPVKLWDESGSSVSAHGVRAAGVTGRKKRSLYLDDLAAAVILQSYLDFLHENSQNPFVSIHDEDN